VSFSPALVNGEMVNEAKELYLFCVLLLSSSYSSAAMDATCFNDCLNGGYQNALCREKCSYVDNSSPGFVPSGALGGYFRGLEEARKNEAHELQRWNDSGLRLNGRSLK
jgi:hypothetical protein